MLNLFNGKDILGVKVGLIQISKTFMCTTIKIESEIRVIQVVKKFQEMNR